MHMYTQHAEKKQTSQDATSLHIYGWMPTIQSYVRSLLTHFSYLILLSQKYFFSPRTVTSGIGDPGAPLKASICFKSYWFATRTWSRRQESGTDDLWIEQSTR